MADKVISRDDFDTYGEYRFENAFHLNAGIKSKSVLYSTFIHEATHLANALTTRHGILTLLLKEVNEIDESYSFLLQNIHKSSSNSHEAMSSFSEIIYVLIRDGKSEVDKKIEYLRDNNKEYYKYIEPLLPLLYATFEYDTSGLISLENLMIILNIAFKLASEIDYESIDLNIYKSERTFNKWYKNGENKVLFSPDIRFNKMIRYLKGNDGLKAYSKPLTETDIHMLIIKCSQIAGVTYYNDLIYRHLDETMLNSLIDNLKQLISNIYCDSKYKLEISEVLSNFNSTSLGISDLLIKVKPLTKELPFKHEMPIIHSDELDLYFKERLCSILLLGLTKTPDGIVLADIILSHSDEKTGSSGMMVG